MNQACWSLNNKLRLKWTVDICRPEEVFALSPAAMADHPSAFQEKLLYDAQVAGTSPLWLTKAWQLSQEALGDQDPLSGSTPAKPGLAFNFSVLYARSAGVEFHCQMPEFPLEVFPAKQW